MSPHRLMLHQAEQPLCNQTHCILIAASLMQEVLTKGQAERHLPAMSPLLGKLEEGSNHSVLSWWFHLLQLVPPRTVARHVHVPIHPSIHPSISNPSSISPPLPCKTQPCSLAGLVSHQSSPIHHSIFYACAIPRDPAKQTEGGARLIVCVVALTVV
jgi:hypothetical protein